MIHPIARFLLVLVGALFLAVVALNPHLEFDTVARYPIEWSAAGLTLFVIAQLPDPRSRP